MKEGEIWLECDDCGLPLHLMDRSQAQRVASNPYNYIVYCFACKADRERALGK
jgi:hypothetical protein